MSDRNQVYSSCFCRHSAESACNSPGRLAARTTTECTSNNVPYASKTKARGFISSLDRYTEPDSKVQLGSTTRRRGIPARDSQEHSLRPDQPPPDNGCTMRSTAPLPGAAC